MKVREHTLAWVKEIATALGAERERVVLVGGASLAFHATVKGVDIRITDDIDWIVDASMVEYTLLRQRLLKQGFREPSPLDEERPICSLAFTSQVRAAAGEKPQLWFDLMPADEKILGFSNRWYAEAIVHAQEVSLGDFTIRVITPVYLLATKLEAFLGRGENDYMASHDLEDALALLAALPDLREQCATGQENVCREIRRQLLAMGSRLADNVMAHFPPTPEGERAVEELVLWLEQLE